MAAQLDQGLLQLQGQLTLVVGVEVLVEIVNQLLQIMEQLAVRESL